jgi:hypothetical protein
VWMLNISSAIMRFPHLSTLVTTFLYPAYATEDLIES